MYICKQKLKSNTVRKTITGLLAIFLMISSELLAYNDNFEAKKATTYSIDGQANEEFWAGCEWYTIDHVWIPYGAEMTAGDFTGRVKFAWTEDVLFIFAEIEDNILSDDHAGVFDHYWEDDCFEVFLDEDHSGGWHQDGSVAYNAFAYHCAINEADVVDIGYSGNVLLNDHVEYDLDTTATNKVYLGAGNSGI